MRQGKLRNTGLVAAAIAFSACTTQNGQDTSTTAASAPTSTSTITAAPTTVAEEARSDFPSSGPVEPGTYHIPSSAWNIAGLTLTMPEGWETQHGSPGAFKVSGPDAEAEFHFVIPDSLFSDPCVGTAPDPWELMEVGPSVDDLANALLDQPHTLATGPVDTTLGGLPAVKIDLTVDDDPETATCNINTPGAVQIWHSAPVDDYFVLGDGTASVYILDVNGERQVFLTQVHAGTRAEDIAEMQTIIDSIEIDPATTTSVPDATVGTLPDLGLPGMSPNEPAGEYGWTSSSGSRGWMHKVSYDPVTEVTRETQIAFGVGVDCFAGEPGAEPTEVTVYSLPIADRTLCVYLIWGEATTPAELMEAHDVIESIRGVPFGEDDIRINFTLPVGWDTG